VFLGALIVLFLVILYFAKTLPSIEEISNREISSHKRSTTVRETVLLYEINGGERRTIVSFDQMPQTLKDATISEEDQNFTTNRVRWKGIARAFLVDLRTGSLAQGASTITHSSHGRLLTLDQTISRNERVDLAIKLNEYIHKDRSCFIPERGPLWPTISGVEEASEAYFGVPSGISIWRKARFLAAIPQAPTYYSPWGSHFSDLLGAKRSSC